MAISREHFGIINTFTKYYIYDFGSLNGTFVNGKRVKKDSLIELNDGNIVSIHEEKYMFRNIILRQLTFNGILRMIPKLLAWRLRATKKVFHPKRMLFNIDGDEGPQPKRQVIIFD